MAAERRMFTTKIIDSDAFLDMPMSAQALYFHLCMRADDDGFLNGPKKTTRMVGASEADLDLLIRKRFILSFPSGVIVIKHWLMHNLIRKDRHTPTVYQEELSALEVKDNGSYTERDNEVTPTCQPSDNQVTTNRQPNDRIGKDRLGKDSKERDLERESPAPPSSPTRHRYGEYQNVLLTDEDLTKLKTEFPTDWGERIERLSSYIAETGKAYKNHLAVIRNWARRDAEEKTAKTVQTRPKGVRGFGYERKPDYSDIIAKKKEA